jgi:hypothetical protein
MTGPACPCPWCGYHRYNCVMLHDPIEFLIAVAEDPTVPMNDRRDAYAHLLDLKDMGIPIVKVIIPPIVVH